MLKDNTLIANTELLLQIIEGLWLIFNTEKHFNQVKTALSEWIIQIILNFAAITLRF